MPSLRRKPMDRLASPFSTCVRRVVASERSKCIFCSCRCQSEGIARKIGAAFISYRGLRWSMACKPSPTATANVLGYSFTEGRDETRLGLLTPVERGGLITPSSLLTCRSSSTSSPIRLMDRPCIHVSIYLHKTIPLLTSPLQLPHPYPKFIQWQNKLT